TDEETAKTLQKALAKQGMSFKLGSKVTQATPSADGVSLTLEPAAGGDAQTLQADYVLVAIGRRPYTQGLNLESVGLSTDKRGML
ncbi:FAD-dependent oxidoreductase, partial [Pseudomonas sp. SIMBA_064]